MNKIIRLTLLASVLFAFPAMAATVSPASAASVHSIEAAPASVPAPAPDTKLFTLTALGMAVGATAPRTSNRNPTAAQIAEANARGITVVSRTGEGEPDAEDYTVALATGTSTPNPVLAAAALRANAPDPNVGKSLGELAMMTDDELKEEADRRGIKVAASTSTVDEAGNAAPSPVSRGDIIKALSSGAASGRFDETIPGGKYTNARGQLVNAHGQKINDDGTMKDPNEQPRTSAEQPY